MAIPTNIQQLEKEKFVNSLSVPDQPVVAVANADGSPVGGSDSYSSMNTGAKTVTTAGTPVALVASTTEARLVAITANIANTGRIAVGDSGVVASTDGFSLGAGETAILPVVANDLAEMFIDSTVNGEGVKFTYFA